MFDLASRLGQLEEAGLLRRRRIVESPPGTQLLVDGKTFLSFCSNDYLGLSNHPGVVAATLRGVEDYGVGATASAIVCGHTRAHEDLEARLASFVRLPRALYFSGGYMANLGILSALLGPGDTIFSDRLNHACLIDGCRLSRASIQVYPHTDVAALEHMLSHSDSPRKLVATDSVFSMDGNIAPLPELLALCERYDAWLLIDDAHGFGVLGEQGRGVLCHYHMASPRILYMGTLGKAAGIFGAFVAGDTTTIEWLMQRARTYVFSTAPPPMLSTGLMASLRLIETEDWRRARIRALAVQLGEGLKNLPWKLLASQTAIQPLIVGDNQAAVDLMEALKGKGIWVPAIRPPTVPVGTARLRISLSAAHTPSDVERLVAALQDIAGEFT